MSDYHNIVLILPSVMSNDYFWHGSKFAYDTRRHDWSRGVLFSPRLVISHIRLLLARHYSWTVTPASNGESDHLLPPCVNKCYGIPSTSPKPYAFVSSTSVSHTIIDGWCKSRTGSFDLTLPVPEPVKDNIEIYRLLSCMLNKTNVQSFAKYSR